MSVLSDKWIKKMVKSHKIITPFIPKSGEQEVQIAPILVVASIHIIASGILGKYAATLSPFKTP